MWARDGGAAVSGIRGRCTLHSWERSRSIFPAGKPGQIKLASNLHRFAHHPGHPERSSLRLHRKKKSGSNQRRALESWRRFLKLRRLPHACYWGRLPSVSTVGLAVRSLTQWGTDCWFACLEEWGRREEPRRPCLAQKLVMGEEKCSLSCSSSGTERRAGQVPAACAPGGLLPSGWAGDGGGGQGRGRWQGDRTARNQVWFVFLLTALTMPSDSDKVPINGKYW